MLFIIQGCGQQKLAKNWGDGLATDAAVVQAMGLSDPNPFFAALMQKPYLAQVRPGRLAGTLAFESNVILLTCKQ